MQRGRGPGRKRYSIIINTGEKNLSANHVKLMTPPLEELVPTLEAALKANFAEVEVKVVECPNLAEFANVAEKGLGGHTRIADVGGEPYLFSPKHARAVSFQLPDVVRACGMPGVALVIGAASASQKVIGKNGELIPNTLIPGPRHTQYAKLDKPMVAEDSDEESEPELSVEHKDPAGYNEPKPVAQRKNSTGKSPPAAEPATPDDVSSPRDFPIVGPSSSGAPTTPTIAEEGPAGDMKSAELVDSPSYAPGMVPVVGHYPSEETGCLANLYMCDGKQGPVLYVKASKRTGRLNLTNCMREALKGHKGVGGENQIGVGGVFRVQKGKVRAHIMPSFPSCKFGDKEATDAWLKFYDFGPDLNMFSVMVTDDPTPDKRLHLRLEHTHFYSDAKHGVHEAGHYHYDVTPDEIVYEGYFNLAEFIYRVEDAFYNIEQDNKT